MMSELFDEEYLREQYYKAERKKALDEGYAEGKAKVIKIVAQRLREMGLSEEKIKEATSI